MNCIMIKLKMNAVTTQSSYSQKLIASCVKLKLKMSLKILVAINECSILVIIWLSQNTMMIQTNYSLEKWKMNFLHAK